MEDKKDIKQLVPPRMPIGEAVKVINNLIDQTMSAGLFKRREDLLYVWDAMDVITNNVSVTL